jgi:hypothetical protein
MIDAKYDQGLVFILYRTIDDHIGKAGNDHLARAREKARAAGMRQMLEERYDLANARTDSYRSAGVRSVR